MQAVASTSARRRSSSSACVGDRKERDGAKSAFVCAEELQCSICFDVLTFPVTLPCGHNFDRGCILTAWEFESQPPDNPNIGGNQLDDDASDSDSDSDDNNDDDQRRRPLNRLPGRNEDADVLCAHSCPLCRQRIWLADPADELQLNRPLQGVVSSLFPLESVRAGTPDKKQPRVHCSDPVSQTRAPQALEPVTLRIDSQSDNHHSNGLVEFLRRPSLRTLSSLLSVWVASLYTVPPGFTLAVLLLLALAAIACGPPATFGVATSSAASPMLLLTLEAVDRVCNGLGLLIRDLSLQLDRPLALIVHLVAVLW